MKNNLLLRIKLNILHIFISSISLLILTYGIFILFGWIFVGFTYNMLLWNLVFHWLFYITFLKKILSELNVDRIKLKQIINKLKKID